MQLNSSDPTGNNQIFGSHVINVSNNERIVSAALGAFFFTRGLRRGSILQTLIGGYLVYRGASGYCPAYKAAERSTYTDKPESVNIKTTIIVNKPRKEVYEFWRKLENLPLFMKHLKSVREIDDRKSHWEANVPGNVTTINWDAEIVKEEEGNLISWRSLPGATVENAGKVDFQDALGHEGTELRVVITYRPPAGHIGSGLAWLINPVFKNMIKKDILNFKEYIETGYLAPVE
ncbi:MAG: SRPBCC family protein [Chitinophagaceae bacterium]